MSAMDRPCSVASCEQPAECGGHLCPEHWADLPDRLREIVSDAWEDFCRHGAVGGRWVSYVSVSRAATGYFATARPISEISRSAMFPVGRVRSPADLT